MARTENSADAVAGFVRAVLIDVPRLIAAQAHLPRRLRDNFIGGGVTGVANQILVDFVRQSGIAALHESDIGRVAPRTNPCRGFSALAFSHTPSPVPVPLRLP